MTQGIRLTQFAVVLVLAGMLAACGGTGLNDAPSVCPGGGCIFGKVVDTNGKPIPGMRLTLGDKTVVSNVSGSFAFSSVSPGTYRLRGDGGLNDHYVLDVPNVKIASGQTVELPEQTAYQMFGVFIIDKGVPRSEPVALGMGLGMESPSTHGGMKLPFEGTVRRQPMSVSSAVDALGIHPMATSGEELVDTYGGYFYLEWEKADGASPEYTIRFLGAQPTGTGKVVWKSTDEHLGDPQFVAEQPAAYLDVDDELSDELGVGMVAGNVYYFQVTSSVPHSPAPDKNYPPIALSFAKRATDFAENISFDRSTRQVTWNGVAQASGYQVLVYDEHHATKVWDSAWDRDGKLVTNTHVSIPSSVNLEQGRYYNWYVDTHFVEGNEWVSEITRNFTGGLW